MAVKKIYILLLILIVTAVLLTIVSLFITSGNYLLNTNPKAIDFLAFFTGAKLLSNSPHELYNLHSQLVSQQHIMPITKTLAIFIPFLNPPFVTLLFIPLLGLSPLLAYDLWLICNVVLILALCYFIFKQAAKQSLLSRVLFLFGILTFIPLLTSLIIGQLSILLCLIIFCSWLLLQKKKLFLSGLCFSLLLIKPHFLLIPLLAFIIQRQKNFLGGIFLGIFLLVLISFFLVGWNGISSYISLLLNASSWNTDYRIDLMAQHSIQTVLLILFHTTDLANIRFVWYFACVLLILPTLFIWKKVYAPTSYQTALQWALLILVMLLTSPHTHFHDLTLLIPVGYWLLTSLPKFTNKQKRKYVVLLLFGYAIAVIGYLFEVWTYKGEIWIVTNVCYLIFLSIVIFRDLTKAKA